jgi:regulator of replication initiation timing
MYDLLNYKEQRIIALMEENKKLRIESEKLTTYLFEVLDKKCPQEYKSVIVKEIFGKK